jgi:hypothetical protein
MKKNILILCYLCFAGASFGQHMYKDLMLRLDSIHVEDQKYRMKLDSIIAKHGLNSREMNALIKAMNTADSVNLIKVVRILDEHGWLSQEQIGGQRSATLFLVIQHSDLQTQEKYLPLMRQAVKDGKAQANQLALLEDRVALRQGKKQIYGSQITQDMNGKYSISPIEDEPNVNKRRAAVGLESLEEYVKRWGIDYKLPSK